METILTSLTLGLLAAGSPCILPMYPGFLACLAGASTRSTRLAGQDWAGLSALAGVVTTMLALGAISSLVSLSMSRVLSYAIPLCDFALITLGGLLLLDLNPFSHIPRVRVPLLPRPLLSAFVYGLLYGPLTLPCSGPLVLSIFAYSLTLREALGNLTVFLWYGLGLGLPLLLISLLTAAAQRRLTRFIAQRTRWINLIAGVLLLAVGGMGLASHWDLLVFFWSGAANQ